MKTLLLLLMSCFSIIPLGYAQNNIFEDLQNPGPIKVADNVTVNISTPHPYKSNTATSVFEREFYSKNASYIALYFENFNLAAGDYVEIYSPETNDKVIYGGTGKIIDDNLTTISNFWSQVILSDKVIVKLHTAQASKGYGFDIKTVAYGYTPKKMEQLSASFKALKICGENDKEAVKCYDGTEIYKKATAVCRLIINSNLTCTGWLLGCEGYLMTNNHCIADESAANNTSVIFNYMKDACTGGKTTRGTSEGKPTFIKTNAKLDYTLLKMPSNISSKYGYLSLDSKPVQMEERIYIAQHPLGDPKEVVTKDDQDTVGYAKADKSSSEGVRYYCDTQGGSSGSPVLKYDNHLVAAIHNSGECKVWGNGSKGRSDQLIHDIGDDMPKCGVNDPNMKVKPTARMEASVNCTTVTFENHSFTNGATYKWDFGDGKTATETAPTHTYAKAGEYTVKLSATNSSGTSTTEAKIKVTSAKKPNDMVKGVCEGEPAVITLPDNGTGYVWYDQPTAGNVIATGNTLKLDAITAETTYYVSATGSKIENTTVGLDKIDKSTSGLQEEDDGSAQIFDAKKDFVLKSFTVYSDSVGKRTLQLKNGVNELLDSKELTIGKGEIVVPVNMTIKAGNDLELGFTKEPKLYRTQLKDKDLPYPFKSADGNIVMKTSRVMYEDPAKNYFYTYNWNVSVIGNCESERAKVTIKITRKPAKPNVEANKTTGVLKVKETFKNYQWFFNGKAISNATAQTYTATKNGTYHAEVSEVDGCNNKSDDIVFDNLSTTLFSLPKGVTMHPNPANSILNITGLNTINTTNTLKIINMLGQTLTTVNSTKINETITVSNLSKGMYFIQINNSYLVKFIKN